MTVNEPLILFSRADCHLCSLAAEMLGRAGFSWEEVDIDGDPGLAVKYGVHVPVVQHRESGRELYFPFDEQKLARFFGDGRV